MTIEWNYRVFLEDNGDYIIREVFYEADGAIAGCCELNVESDRPFCYLGKKSARSLEKETIALHSKLYETALRYCVTGFKSISSLSVSILNRSRGMPAATKASTARSSFSTYRGMTIAIPSENWKIFTSVRSRNIG